MTPTAEQVARTMIAAAAQCVVDPIDLGTIFSPRGLPRDRYQMISRARFYCACALRDAYELSETATSRIIGVNNPDVWMSSMRKSIAASQWYDERVAVAVLAAAELALTPRPSPPAEPEAIPAFLPKRSEPRFITLSDKPTPASKQALRNMLAEAVRNTANLQKE